jgi:hypothetical protein
MQAGLIVGAVFGGLVILSLGGYIAMKILYACKATSEPVYTHIQSPVASVNYRW